MSSPSRLSTAICLCIAGWAVCPAEALTQSWDGDWSVVGSVGGTIFFGNSDQSLFTSQIEFERADELFESSTDFGFTYGVSTDADGVTEVSRRSWVASTGLDFRPGDGISPFVSGRMESSFERRIGLRYDAGAGFSVSRVEDRQNRIDFSLQILAERTYGRVDGSTAADEVSLTRWSSALRVRRAVWNERIRFDLRNNYRPVFDAFGNFTLSSINTATLEVTEVVGLRFGFRINHDSGAMKRGADTNRDGRVEMSIVAQF